MEEGIETKLTEIETGEIEEINVISKNSKHYIFSSLHKLNNYSSYQFTLQAKDNCGNTMIEPLEIIFLPIIREVNDD